MSNKKPFYEEYQQSFSVPFEYPVYFTRSLFSLENPLLINVMDRLKEGKRHRAAVYIDGGVAAAHASLISQINSYFQKYAEKAELKTEPLIIPGGEAAKDGWETVKQRINEIGKLHLDRQSFIIAVGGGAVLDMTGFAAAIIHRGIRLIRVPTTTLAQNDAGIGVKNSINDQGQKNFIGTFAPPFAVLNDSDFLHTLTFEQWIGGISEAFKVAIIKDAEFFDYLKKYSSELKKRNQEVMEYAVYRCAFLHLEHIRNNGDPFEFGSARPLDFGHWAAHKLESMSNYAIGHGQAVSIGISLDSYAAMKQGLITLNELEQILEGFNSCGLPIWDNLLNRRNKSGNLEILDGLEEFREHLGGKLTITLPAGIGKKIEVHHMDIAAVEEGIQFLHMRHNGKAF